jgi:hypothetical protein
MRNEVKAPSTLALCRRSPKRIGPNDAQGWFEGDRGTSAVLNGVSHGGFSTVKLRWAILSQSPLKPAKGGRYPLLASLSPLREHLVL